MRSLIFIWFVLMAISVQAQESLRNYSLDTEDALDRMMELVLEDDEKHQTMDGFRIQIGLNRNRALAQEFRAEFIKANPDIPSYVTYQAPNFKIRIGDFETKLQAVKARAELSEDYKDAFIVKTQIEIIKYELEEEELEEDTNSETTENTKQIESGQ